jgi:hypothetical protein
LIFDGGKKPIDDASWISARPSGKTPINVHQHAFWRGALTQIGQIQASAKKIGRQQNEAVGQKECIDKNQ